MTENPYMSYPNPGQYPPPGPPMPPMGMPPPVAKKKFPLWAKIVIPIVSVIVIFVLGMIIWAVNFVKNGDGDSRAFLKNLENGNYSAAYAQFSPQAKLAQSLDRMSVEVDTLKLSPQCSEKWTSRSIRKGVGGTDTKAAGGTLRCPNAPYPSYNMEFSWIKQSGSYKLNGYTIRP